ncbi:MAG: hypothetical protein IJU52_03300 [Clostridia bacterium]|nr:hypothetical protein [Clostridia bacterium]
MNGNTALHPVRRSLAAVGLTLLILFAAATVTILTRGTFLRPVVPVFYIFLSTWFTLRVHGRVVDRRVRAFLTLSSSMIALLAFLCAVKYFAFTAPGAAARYVWYLYYLPILAAPTFLYLAAVCHDLRPGKRPRAAVFLPALLSLILFLSVLTNDLHFLAFSFRPGFANWDADYARGPFYYIPVIWAVMLLFFAVGIFAHKSRLSALRKLTVIPPAPIVAALLFSILYLLDRQPKYDGINVFEFQEVLCFSCACFIECCLAIGLVPSNEGYSSLFSLSSVCAAITDNAGKTVYASSRSALREDRRPPQKTPVMLDGDTRLESAEVRGGRVYWQDDLTAINRVNAGLAEAEERLREEAVLIRLQNELKAEQARTLEKNRVYDLIAQSVRAQSEAIVSLADGAQSALRTPGGEIDAADKLKRICVPAAYIKRRANLTLLYENGEAAGGKELLLALDGSLRALSLSGLPALRTGALSADLCKEEALGFYDAFEELVERALPALSGVHIAARENVLRLTFENALPALTEERAARLESAGVRFTVRREDQSAYYTFVFEGRDAR